jgi:hypothetical protein
LNVDVASKFGSGFEEYWPASNVPPGAGPLLADEEAEEVFFGDEPP